MRYQAVGRRAEAVDVTSASWALSGTYGQPVAFQCNAATTITGALVGDTAETAWILPAGVYPLAFKSINTSSTTKNGYKVLYE